MPSIQTIGLTAHRKKVGAAEALKSVASYIESCGLRCVVDGETAEALDWTGKSMPWDDFLAEVDMLLTLGGDGTLLHIADIVAPLNIPIGGINMGRLGFLTACSIKDFEKLIDCIIDGNYKIEERALLQVSLTESRGQAARGKVLSRYWALNEVAVIRGKTGRMVDVETFINGEFLTNYHADGLLVATASGSTAYSLSAGGPIISPGSGVLCLTPVCPHSLTTRSLIVAKSSVIEIRSRKNDEGEYPLVFSVDGCEAEPLGKGMVLRVEQAPCSLRIVRLPNYSFHKILRAKLKWRGAEV